MWKTFTRERQLIANILKDQFQSVFTDTNSGSWREYISSINITTESVFQLLQELDSYKASGLDGIPSNF